jgi:hypothetical protein
MVMAYSGAAPADLDVRNHAELRGSLQPALYRRVPHGWLAWEISEFDEILQEIAAARPVIILQTAG